MGSSGHGCSSIRMLTASPQAVPIRSANIEGSMKRSPMIAMVSDIGASRAQGGEPLPGRARGKPCLQIDRKHLFVARRETRVGSLRLAEMRRHPIIGTRRHVGIAPGRDRGDHRGTGGASLLPAADTNIRAESSTEDGAKRTT